MKARSFLNRVSNSEHDVLQLFLDLLKKHHADFCVVGGLAVNAFAELVVSLDLDLVLATNRLQEVLEDLPETFKVEEFPHSINISFSSSDLRILLPTNYRDQEFIKRARRQQVLGYNVTVARIDDVLQGKIWAYQDQTRRPSKRQEDLADIFRLVEARPGLREQLPSSIGEMLD